jgi:hypothetical protein
MKKWWKLSLSLIALGFVFTGIVTTVFRPNYIRAEEGCNLACCTCCGYCDCGNNPGVCGTPQPSAVCFLPGTKVDTPDGEKNIETIQVGDVVTSFDNDQVGKNDVSNIYKSQRDFYYDLKAGDYAVKVTAEHPFYVGNGKFVEVQYLKSGDTVYILKADKTLEKKLITSNIKVNEKTDVYNMTVDKTHTYFANSFAVHNKGSGNCNGTGVTVNCPAGTVRSSVVVGTQCAKMCNGLGTAQAAGTCCDVVSYNASGCHNECTFNPRTGNNRCKKVCDEPGGSYCRTGTTITYRCDPICSAPGPITLSLPADNASLTSTTVNLAWNAATFPNQTGCTKQYKIYVGAVGQTPTLYATVNNSITSLNYTGTRGVTYQWYVQAANGTVTTTSATRRFTVLNNQITGVVFYDSNNDCVVSPGTSDRWKKGAGMTVTIPGTSYSASVPSVNNGGTGVFTITAVAGETYPTMTLNNIPPGYSCSTGPGCGACTTLTNVTTPSSNHRFYLTDRFAGWWQVEGAGIYAGNAEGASDAIRSDLPSSARLILAGSGGSAAALIRGAGSADLGAGQVSDSLWTTTSKYKGKKMDYSYFAAQMGVVPDQVEDFASGMTEPNAVKDFYYTEPDGGIATISSPWTVGSSEKYIVFVNGDLRIAADITVAPGGFLSFIVNGDITVAPAVTDIEGLYIASNNFVTETVDITEVIADVALDVNGTVIAWGSMQLDRSLVSGNSTTPAEKFTYRPDLLTNMPEKMKTFAMNWQEVVAGTFEEEEEQ